MGKGKGHSSERQALEVDPKAILDSPPLKGHQVISLNYIGSRAYGLEHQDSDWDFRGIYMAPSTQLFTLQSPQEQLEDKARDLVVFELGKFAKLAAAANPNILEIFFAPSLHKSPEADQLYEARELFLSSRIKTTYAGFAQGQLKMLSKETGARREKAARHLFRIFEHGKELLTEKTLTIKVSDPEALREKSKWDDIRIEQEFKRLDQEFKNLETELPEKPNLEAINQLLISMRLKNLEI